MLTAAKVDQALHPPNPQVDPLLEKLHANSVLSPSLLQSECRGHRVHFPALFQPTAKCKRRLNSKNQLDLRHLHSQTAKEIKLRIEMLSMLIRRVVNPRPCSREMHRFSNPSSQFMTELIEIQNLIMNSKQNVHSYQLHYVLFILSHPLRDMFA